MNDLTSGSSTARPNASPDALVDRLFQRLGAMYGRAWLDMWVGAPMDAVKAEWARALTGVAPEAIRLALESIVTQGKTFPPNMPEFVSLCRQFIRRGPHRLAIAAPRYEPPENIFAKLKRELKA